MNLSKSLVRIGPGQQFLAAGVLSLLMLWTPLKALLALSLRDERYMYIPALPIISAGFIYLERVRIFRDSRYCPAVGVPVMLPGLLMCFMSTMRLPLSGNVTVAAAALVLLWIGAFIHCYGVGSARNASFALSFLFLIVPIPIVILDRAIAGLQAGSADLAYVLFRISSVPVWRHGMIMSLPGVDIEVAPQCSGIRSTMALFLAGVVISRLLLRTTWARLIAVLCVVPIGIFRNAVRIVCISLLGVYVDSGFFSGTLHRYGGLPFSVVGFALLMPLVWLLRKWERRLRAGRIGVGVAAARF